VKNQKVHFPLKTLERSQKSVRIYI